MHRAALLWAALLLALAPVSAPAAVSWMVKHELDHTEALLRERFAELPAASGVVMVRDPQRLTLRMPVALLFDPDSLELKSGAARMLPLSATVQVLRQRRRLQAQIEVYTDTIGGTAVNQMASERRAQAIAFALGLAGVDSLRLHAQGAGNAAPIGDNTTAEGRSVNRRVEIVLGRAGALNRAGH